MQTPAWTHDAIFYQIFPDRFARSGRVQHPRGIRFKPWGSPPEEQGFQGGDLYGVVEKLDYLQDLGVNALYLNPIFASAANHRYHTYDYYHVDPLLGGNAALRLLLDAAHSRGMFVVLDGVFNHASRGFWPFHHVLENGPDSPYVDWFIINGWPLRPYSSDAENPPNYAAWWNLPALPKLNTANPGVRDFLFDVARHWVEFGIDGWRLDVPNEIDDDDFWRQFRRVVKEANPRAYIVGEIWGDARRWLQGDMFDAVMNYPLAEAVLSFFGAASLRPYQQGEFHLSPLDAPAFASRLQALLGRYDWQVNLAQLNLLDSHDMPRALWLLGDDKSALRLAVLFQMTVPGAPCIYYGDEIGLSSPGDPHCRQAFPWQQPEIWDHELRDYYRRAIALRRQNPVLRRGNFEILLAEGDLFAFERRWQEKTAVVLFNVGERAQQASLRPRSPAPAFYRGWPQADGRVPVQDGALQLEIPPRQGVVLFA